jgi:hypothetical protein
MDMAPTDDMKSSREFTAGSGRLPTTKRAADVTSAQLTSVSTRTTDQRVRRARAVKCARAVGCARTCTSRQDLASRYAACSRRSGPNACMQWREVKGSVHMATHEHMATHASHLVHRHLPRPRPRPRPLLLVHLGTRRHPRRPPPCNPRRLHVAWRTPASHSAPSSALRAAAAAAGRLLACPARRSLPTLRLALPSCFLFRDAVLQRGTRNL